MPLTFCLLGSKHPCTIEGIRVHIFCNYIVDSISLLHIPRLLLGSTSAVRYKFYIILFITQVLSYSLVTVLSIGNLIRAPFVSAKCSLNVALPSKWSIDFVYLDDVSQGTRFRPRLSKRKDGLDV